MEKEKPASVNKIEVIEGLEAVRRRPNLYLGDFNRQGLLEELLLESLCHAIDEVIESNCTYIDINIDSKIITVTYDAGMPLKVHHKTGRVAAEAILYYLYACHNLKKNIEVGSKYCQYGLAVLNAVCSLFKADIIDGNLHGVQIYQKGKVVEKFNIVPCQHPDRTRLIFQFDEKLLGIHDLDFTFLLEKVTELMQELKIFISLRQSI